MSYLSQKIINGQFRSYQQVIRALYQIWLDTDYDSDYAIWYHLDEALYSLRAWDFPYSYPSATLENFDAIVKQEATKFILSVESEKF